VKKYISWLHFKDLQLNRPNPYIKWSIFFTTSVGLSRGINILCIISKITAFLIISLSSLGICEGWHLINMWQAGVYDRIISLREDVWPHKTSLIPPLFIEVPVPSQEYERSCICVLSIWWYWYCLFLEISY
jgi:hypothetical protein